MAEIQRCIDFRSADHSTLGRMVSAGLAGFLSLCVAQPCSALMMFDAPRPLASNAATDDPSPAVVDIWPSVAGDGNGNWIAVWSSNDATVGVHAGALGQDAVFSRSVDDGRAWSPVAILNSDAVTRDAKSAAIATNKEGTWIAALHGDVVRCHEAPQHPPCRVGSHPGQREAVGFQRIVDGRIEIADCSIEPLLDGRQIFQLG